jgi:hypothetical protein
MTDFAGVSTHDGLRRVFVGIKDDILSNRLVHGAKQPAIEPYRRAIPAEQSR